MANKALGSKQFYDVQNTKVTVILWDYQQINYNSDGTCYTMLISECLSKSHGVSLVTLVSFLIDYFKMGNCNGKLITLNRKYDRSK